MSNFLMVYIAIGFLLMASNYYFIQNYIGIISIRLRELQEIYNIEVDPYTGFEKKVGAMLCMALFPMLRWACSLLIWSMATWDNDKWDKLVENLRRKRENKK